MKLKVLCCLFFGKFREGYTIKLLNDYPGKVCPDTLYVIGTKRHPQYAIFLCPCGCSQPIELNLNATSSPVWKLKWHTLGTVSLVPSIQRNIGCRSHFFLRKSKICWCV